MVDSIVSVDTVTVTGGPSTVNVQLDFGPEGQRGSLILYGLGKPTDPGIVFPQTPQLLDWFINLDTADNEYLYIYQYVNRDGSNTWDRIFKIIPNTYSTNETVTFTNGVGVANLAVSNTTLPLLSLLLDNSGQFIAYAGSIKPNIAMSFEEANNPLLAFPIASSFIVGTPEFDQQTNLINLPITISAAQFVPNPTPDNVVMTFADMLAITDTTETNVDGMYVVYVTSTSTFYVWDGINGTSLPTSWIPFSNVQPLSGEKEVHITVNVIS